MFTSFFHPNPKKKKNTLAIFGTLGFNKIPDRDQNTSRRQIKAETAGFLQTHDQRVTSLEQHESSPSWATLTQELGFGGFGLHQSKKNRTSLSLL